MYIKTMNWYGLQTEEFVKMDKKGRGNRMWMTLEGSSGLALPPGTSAPKVELIALTQALERAEGKRIAIFIPTAGMHLEQCIFRAQFIESEGFTTAEGKRS